MTWWDFIVDNRTGLLVAWREHVWLVVAATVLAVMIGVPLGIAAARRPQLRNAVFMVVNIVQTVPSLALFGLLLPLPWLGGIGARTAIVALTLYALLPIVRNTATGILGVEPSVREAAEALGLTGWQRLRYVELPLAANVILAGVRTAVTLAVGTATIAAAVGAGGLGAFIFRGLRQNDNRLLVTGGVLAALLALLADAVFAAFERRPPPPAAPQTSRRLAAAAGLALIFLPVAWSYRAASPVAKVSRRPVVVGSKDFTESVILAEILAQRLEAQGVAVERRFELGGHLAHESLLAGAIDVYPEYTGTAWTAILGERPLTDPQAVYAGVRRDYAARFGLVVGPPLGFRNDFAILVRRQTAMQYSLRTISDAARAPLRWRAGFGQDFMSRADGYAGFCAAYGFRFETPREMELSLTYRALAAGELDIIAGNATDGLIAALDLVALEDDRRYFPPYQAVYVVRRAAWEATPELAEAVRALDGVIDTDTMRRLNDAVDGEKRTPREVAAAFLAGGFRKSTGGRK
ncbi:MAG: ABC transporter permease subunit [Chloracidobacterium sp.]|nr:ABC transporter permease subunit [Chloracidobacterium sp.]MDW8218565.1 glycine betaine ABC transporter substrate-binding protein [Acidobacteriota bacterium]